MVSSESVAFSKAKYCAEEKTTRQSIAKITQKLIYNHSMKFL